MTALRWLPAAGLLGLALFAAGGATAGDVIVSSKDVTGVVELFTSQGCSSCPPAERLLTKMADEPGIVALAYHVDYWDYIGWKDTFGSRANTERQRAYASAFGTNTIYTPQMVVNGQRDVVGSHAAEIRKALDETSLDKDGAIDAEIRLRASGDRLHISASAVAPGYEGPMPVLMLITFDDRSEIPVSRGENSGMTLVNTHSVRDWRILGMWVGKPLEVDIPVSTLMPDGEGRSGCAAVLQAVTANGEPGPILAAAAMEFGAD